MFFTESSDVKPLPDNLCNIDLDFIEDEDDPIIDPDFRETSTSSESESEVSLLKRKKKVKKNLILKRTVKDTSKDNENTKNPGTSGLLQEKKRSLKGDTRLVRKERKFKRNMGEGYTTKKGKKVPKRTMQPLKNKCRNKCQEKISE